MILVDVYIPSMDNTYDFMLEENVPVEQVIVEICDMLSRKVKSPAPAKMEDFMMCSMDEDKILDKQETLYGNGIRDGSRLMLV